MERVLKPSSPKILITLILFLVCSAQSSLATTAIIPSDDDMVIGGNPEAKLLRSKVLRPNE
jgi:hypothetical protein